MIWRERKKTVLLNTMMQRFMERENSIVSAFARLFSVRRTCLHLQRQRSSIGCEVDSSYVTDGRPPLILPYIVQQLSKKSNLDGDENVLRFYQYVYLVGRSD